MKLIGVAQNMHQNKKSSERKVVGGGRRKREREKERSAFGENVNERKIMKFIYE